MSPATDFVHLRLHSEFDVRQGVARLSGENSVVAYAADMGQPALALTDTGCLFGAVKFYDSCRQHGIKPIIGCEVKIDEKNPFYILMLCMNKDGYVNLSRLISRAYAEGGWVRPQWLTATTTAGIIALAGGRRNDISAGILRGREKSALKTAQQWAKRFPDRLYLEVWRATEVDNTLTAGLAEIGHLAGLPVVATHPVQSTRADDWETLNARLCIAHGRQMNDKSRQQPLSEQPYLLSTADMQEKFADLSGVLDNSVEIAKRCNFNFDFGTTHMPSLPSSSRKDGHFSITKLAEEGLAKKLPPDLSTEKKKAYDDRLRYELSVIAGMNFSDYFLIVMDFIHWAKTNDVPVGPGRGSGSGSLVAYALDITTLDPIHYGLLFERFLNPERVSLPDFDIDFCVEGRDRVIRYVEEKYGSNHVSQIVTFGTIGARGAIRDVGRVLGMPYGFCDRIARLIPNGINITLKQALTESAELAEEQQSEEGGTLINLALKVEGLPRNIGTHAGGVLITPRPLETYCPRYIAADTQTLVSQLDMVDIEKIGLVKFDFLGLRTLTILAHAEHHLRATATVADDFSLEDIPLDDASVYHLYAEGDTTGIFQCESTGMRELMRRLRPDRFTDITALMALYRPGPLKSGLVDSYIRRKHKEEDITYPHPCTEAALAETYGVCIYQEQVMELSRLIANYSLAEADLLRRAMGKKKEEEMAAQRVHFIEGARDKLSTAQATVVFENIETFAGYGFNKSHATAYALLSYRTAYLKKHYPAAFLAAVMSAEAGDTDRIHILVSHARQIGITVHPPDINISHHDFKALDEKSIAYGLEAIKGVGKTAITNFISERAQRPFSDLFDCCQRLSSHQQISTNLLETLVLAGAFDVIHPNRAAVFLTLPAAMGQNRASGSLFGNNTTLADTPSWSLRERLTHERQALGFCLTGSFYQTYADLLKQLPLSHQQIAHIPLRQEVRIAGLYTRILATRKMRQHGFGIVVISDDSGEIEVRVNSTTIKPLRALTSGEALLIVEGTVQSNPRSGLSISATAVLSLDDFFNQRLRRLTLHCQPAMDVTNLQKMLPPARATGGCDIILHYRDETLSCDCSLGGGWSVACLSYDRLKNLPHIQKAELLF